MKVLKNTVKLSENTTLFLVPATVIESDINRFFFVFLAGNPKL